MTLFLSFLRRLLPPIPGWENGYSFGVVDAHGRDRPKPGPDGTSVLQRTPKLLEYLVYWTLSSMGVPDGLYIPPVSNEVPCSERELPCTVYDMRAKCDEPCAVYFQELASRLRTVSSS